MPFDITVTNATSFQRLPATKMRTAVAEVLTGERIAPKHVAGISIVLFDNAQLRAMNKEFLNHDYDTDIITFSLDDERIDGELYISVEMAEDNARHYSVSRTNELVRLAIHGTLHLLGYDDATPEERAQMEIKENLYIRRAYSQRTT